MTAEPPSYTPETELKGLFAAFLPTSTELQRTTWTEICAKNFALTVKDLEPFDDSAWRDMGLPMALMAQLKHVVRQVYPPKHPREQRTSLDDDEQERRNRPKEGDLIRRSQRRYVNPPPGARAPTSRFSEHKEEESPNDIALRKLRNRVRLCSTAVAQQQYILWKWNNFQDLTFTDDLDDAMRSAIDKRHRLGTLPSAAEAELSLDEAKSELRDATTELGNAEKRTRVQAAAAPLTATVCFESYIDAAPNAERNQRSGGRLSVKASVKVQFDKFKQDCLVATKALAEKKCENIDKSQQPLPCIIAASGQGKTEGLLWLLENANNIHQSIMDQWNEPPTPPEAVEAACVPEGGTKAAPHVKHLVPLFATFNQDTPFRRGYDTRADSALVRRMICRWAGKVFEVSRDLPLQADLASFLGYVRTAQARGVGCRTDEVGILLLVDEIRRLNSEPNLRNDVVAAITCVMQSDIKRGFCTIPVMTCLDVKTLFSELNSRPLICIRMRPCIGVPPEILQAALSKLRNVSLTPEQDRLKPTYGLSQCSGHYRSLEHIVEHPNEHTSAILLTDEYADAAMHLLATLIRSPDHTMFREDYQFGVTSPKPLSEMALRGCAATTYADFDAVNQLVRPSIIPFALLSWARAPVIKTGLHGVIAELLADVVAGLLNADNKTWERTVPMMECVVAILFSMHNMVLQVSWLDLYGVTDPAITDRVLINGSPPSTTSSRLRQLVQWSDCKAWTTGERNVTAQRQELREHLNQQSDTGLVSGFPANSAYPGVDGCHRLFDQRIFVQSKLYKATTVTKSMVQSWAKAAHKEAKNIVAQRAKKSSPPNKGAKGKTVKKETTGKAGKKVVATVYLKPMMLTAPFFVVMYVSKDEPVDLTARDLPANTAVVFRAGLTHLLSPFGMLPLLEEIDAHATGLPASR